ncbi:MAG: type I phosphomannose isomerase catalytic subunit [Phycisphaerales bacterium]
MPSPAPTPLPPLLLQPTLLPKVWGGRRLAQLDKPLPADPATLIGESWELADLASTSAGGAGGQAVRSIIADGPELLKGRTLHDALVLHAEAIMGLSPSSSADAHAFPLLFKFLDAAQPLSVQVHPSPGHAARTKDAHLKTESWYIVAAEPGAKLHIGFRPGVARTAFALAARNGDPALVHMLREVPAVPGECHTLPSGTVHALGAGVLVAEVQTASDTTYRLYDWGRAGREMHIAEALRCCRFEDDPTEARIGPDGPPTRAALGPADTRGRIAATDHYTLEELRPKPGQPLPLIDPADAAAPTRPIVLMVLTGHGTLTHAAAAFPDRPISTGQTLLIPASAAQATAIRADSAGLRLLSTLVR